MYPDTPARRLAAVASLVLTPVLALVFTVLSPPFPDSTAERLAGFADGPLPAVSAVAFLVMQLPMLVAILAIGRLLIPRAPRLSAWGTALSVIGCYGHIAFGGVSLTYLVMAHDEANRAVYADLVDRIEGSPVMVFAAAGFLGSAVGMLLLAVGLFRARTGPVWVGPALGAFLLLDFVAGNFTEYAFYLGVVLFTAALWAIADVVRRGPGEDVGAGADVTVASPASR